MAVFLLLLLLRLEHYVQDGHLGSFCFNLIIAYRRRFSRRAWSVQKLSRVDPVATAAVTTPHRPGWPRSARHVKCSTWQAFAFWFDS